MRGFIAAQREDCDNIAPLRRRAGWLTQLRWTLAWFVVGVADYTVSRRLNFGLSERPRSGGLRSVQFNLNRSLSFVEGILSSIGALRQAQGYCDGIQAEQDRPQSFQPRTRHGGTYTLERVVDARKCGAKSNGRGRGTDRPERRRRAPAHCVATVMRPTPAGRSKRATRQHAVRLVEPCAAMISSTSAASVHRDDGCRECLSQIVDEILVGLDRDQRRIARIFSTGGRMFRHRGHIQRQLGISPVDRFQHMADQRRRRRNDDPAMTGCLISRGRTCPRPEKRFNPIQPCGQALWFRAAPA